MRALERAVVEAVWQAAAGYLPAHIDTHPWGSGCHNLRTSDRAASMACSSSWSPAVRGPPPAGWLAARRPHHAADAHGIPIGFVCAAASVHDHRLLAETLQAVERRLGLVAEAAASADGVVVHLDAGYDNGPTRRLLAKSGVQGEITRHGPGTKRGDRPQQRRHRERRSRRRQHRSRRHGDRQVTPPTASADR